MKRHTLLLGALALLLVAADDTDDTKKEMDRFRGTWKFESIEVEGQALPEEGVKGSRLIIDGDKFTAKDSQATYKGTFKVDISKKPKTIDVTFTEGPEKGTTMLGIYELEGDTYKVCLDPQGKERPTKFETKKGSRNVLEVLKREKKE